MPLNTQLGVKKEVTYGTPVVVDTFFELESESITPEIDTIAPQVMRTTTRTVRYDRFVRGITGHAGSVSLPVMTKEFGFWLEHLVGGSVTTGSVTDSTYTHSVDVASLCGKGFTLQVNRPRGICGDTDQAFTYAGGKVSDWTISCETGGVVMLEANCTFQSMLMTTALASASYAAGMEFLPWGASSITVGGLALPVSNWSVSCDNGMQNDRLQIKGSYQRGEPVEGMREITFEATCDLEAYVDGTPSGKVGFLNKILTTGGVAATVADSYEPVVITSNGPTLAGAATYPSLVISMAAVRIDEAFGNVDGPDMTEITVKGTAMVPSSGDICKLSYTTTDATA